MPPPPTPLPLQELEARNYSLFNYINNMSADNDALDARISRLMIEVSRYKGKGSQQAKKRQEQESRLETRLHHKLDQIDKNEAMIEAVNSSVAGLSDSVVNAYHKIGCNHDNQLTTPKTNEVLGKLMGGAAGKNHGRIGRAMSSINEAHSAGEKESKVAMETILPLVGLIEMRAVEIIAMFSATRHTRPSNSVEDSESIANNIFGGPAYPSSFVDGFDADGKSEVRPSFFPDSMGGDGDESDLSDEFEDPMTGEICARPLTRTELFSRAQEKLGRETTQHKMQTFKKSGSFMAGAGADGKRNSLVGANGLGLKGGQMSYDL